MSVTREEMGPGMSTRCQIFLLDTTNTLLNYYRHCDGYLSGCGAELLDISDVMSKDFLGNDINVSGFQKGRFAAKLDNDDEYEYEGDEVPSLFIYEDIEFLYYCNDNTGEVWYKPMHGYDNKRYWPEEEQKKFFKDPEEYAKQNFLPLTQLDVKVDIKL